MGSRVFTVGHSTHSVSKFIELLRAHSVTAVADVRSMPYSRVNPQFNRETLTHELRASGIAYSFLGRELGARSEDPTCYEGGRVQYDRIARTTLFQAGLTRVEQGSAKYRIAMMCAEKDPLTCHRTILVSRHLVGRGLGVEHILATGLSESHEDALSRLMDEERLRSADLFQNRLQLEEAAYAKRGQQIAYVLQDLESRQVSSR